MAVKLYIPGDILAASNLVITDTSKFSGIG